MALFNRAIAGLTFRQALARRCWMAVALLAALPVLTALVTRIYAGDDPPITVVTEILTSLSVTVVIPVIALVLASSGFGAEIDDGTVVYLLTKPVGRPAIVATKLAVTALIGIVTAVTSTLVTGLIALHEFDATRVVLAFLVASALGAFLYTAIFLALGLITRRGMLIGLIYLVVWEGTASQLFPGMRSLSVRQYMLSVADAISTATPGQPLSTVPHATAYQMSAIVAIAAIALSVVRLRNFEVGQSG
jgi:ABC-2 type transport system permease protein